MRMNVRHVHYVVMIFLILALAFAQSYLLGRLPWSVFYFDLVTIFVVYMAVEHPFFDAFVRSIVAALVVSSLSAAPSGFYTMYYIQIILLSAFISKRVVLWSPLSQFALLGAMLSHKYVLFAILIVSQGGAFYFWEFLWSALPSVLSSSVLALLCFRLFAALDVFFELQRGREDNQYSLT
jgi:hypothetical protein